MSEKHANFIVNDQRGTAADVRRLAEHVRGQVLARHGIDLAFEVEFAGDWSGWPTQEGADPGGPLPSALGHDPASTPVAVVLGGPSAEHDVSIVSGTAILDALVGSGYPVEAWLVDLDGGWWRLPDGHRRDGRPQAAYDDPAALGAEGPVGAAAALDRLAAAAHRPVVFIALHGPFGEDGTVQALCEAAGLAYTGSGVAASAIGMDKAVFKRLIRGLGLPVVDWREVRLARWTRDRDGVLAELEAFAAGTGDERLMVKPARLGSSVGMTLAHAAGERAARARHRVPLRRPRARRALPRGLAGPRGRGDRQRAGRDRAVRPGRDRRRPRVLRLRGQVHRRAVRDHDAGAEVTPPRRRSSSSSPGTPTARRAAKGSRAWTSCWRATELVVSEINTIPGFTPISLFPTLPAAAGYDFAAVCRRVVDLALEREAGRVRHRLTAADLPR